MTAHSWQAYVESLTFGLESGIKSPGVGGTIRVEPNHHDIPCGCENWRRGR